MSVVGSNALSPAPALKPTTAAGATKPTLITEDSTVISVEMAPGATVNVPIKFRHIGPNRRLKLEIINFGIKGKRGEAEEPERYDSEVTFTWAPGIVGANPRTLHDEYEEALHPGGLLPTSDLSFVPPVVGLPSKVDGETLRIQHRHIAGGADVKEVRIVVQVREEKLYEEIPGGGGGIGAPGTVTTAGAVTGVARPGQRIVGSNGGATKMTPVFIKPAEEEKGKAS